MGKYTELVDSVEDAWRAMQEEWKDIPDAVVVVGSGGRAAKNLYGHFAPNRWEYEGKEYHEVLIVAEQLHRGATALMTTLLHEGVHGVANTRDIKDCSGRRHNKRFKLLAEEMGLVAPEFPDKTIGWSSFDISDSLEWQFQKQINKISEALNLCRLLPTEKEKIKNSWAAECHCSRKIRIGKKIFDPENPDLDLNIICGVCKGSFQVEELV